MNIDLAKQLVSLLPASSEGLFNPWLSDCPKDLNNSTENKLFRLACHLGCQDPKFILIGEAPGYQGCRYSGIAFTSERLLLEGKIPRVSAPAGRLSVREKPFSEPSATIVWGALYDLGIQEKTILWNALQMHPYKASNIWSNRTPTFEEILRGRRALEHLLRSFPQAMPVAVGQKAQDLLSEMGLNFPKVRHPANGGASLFRSQLKELLKNN